jgi:hypothetical protein
MISDRRFFVAAMGAAALAGAAVAVVCERWRRKHLGRFVNPLYGLKTVRNAASLAEQGRVTAVVVRQAASEAEERSRNEPQQEPPRRSRGTSAEAASAAVPELPAEFLAKHPKGCGVELVRTDVQVTSVLMLPVAHLSEYIDGGGACAEDANRLGAGMLSDYNQFSGREDLILGDIVRKRGMAPVSRGYLRAGPRKALYFRPAEAHHMLYAMVCHAML